MEWTYIRAEDFCNSVRDGTHDTPKPVENGYKLVTGKHIRDGIIDPTEAYYISEKDYIKINERSKVDQWDVLMSMIGNGLGRSAVVKEQPDYAIKNIALFKVGDEKRAKWLHYYLSGSEGQGLIYNSLQGSGQPFISLSYLREFPIPNPPKDVIEKVVRVLERYDALIENNQKQIKLLEEAAQRLYQEWFLDLHFPGYEDVQISDGVPEEWIEIKISDLGEIITGKTPSTANSEYYGGSIPFVKIPDMHNNVYPIITESYLTEEGANTQRNKYIPKNSLMVSCIATVGLVNIAVEECQTNQQINSVVLHDEYDLYYAYFTLQRLKELLEGVGSNGATMTNVNKAKFGNLPVIYPSKKLVRCFYDFCVPIFKDIFIKSIEVINLTEARDRLLPKLMSGEIEL